MRLIALVCLLPAALGCAFEPLERDGEDVTLGSAESAVQSENGLLTNALLTNALLTNGLLTNGLLTNGLLTNGLLTNGLLTNGLPIYDSLVAVLGDQGQSGSASRMFMKYLVSCSLDAGQSFSFSWTDILNLQHNETYNGALGLAPEWASGPLSESKQRWVSACLAARTNYFGVSVPISLRGNDSSMATTATERSTYTHLEGAFWGNIFAPTPTLSACHHGPEVLYSRLMQRVCAVGHISLFTLLSCGSIERVGACPSTCTQQFDDHVGFSECGGQAEVITVFLN